MMKISKAQLRRIIREELAEGGREQMTHEIPPNLLPLETVAKMVKSLQQRVDNIENKLMDRGDPGPGAPFQESKK